MGRGGYAWKCRTLLARQSDHLWYDQASNAVRGLADETLARAFFAGISSPNMEIPQNVAPGRSCLDDG